jgi:phytoene dehydrogenase-like protein
VLLRAHVRRITVRDGQVAGVVLENGQRIRTPVVISNADAFQTFEELIGFDQLPGPFVTRLRGMVPSISAVVAYLATDLDLTQAGLAPEVCYFRSWDHDENYRNILAGRPAGAYLAIPTLVDPALAPPGEHIVTVTTLVPYELVESWRDEKERFATMLLNYADEVIPGIRDRLTFMEGASPRTMERYTLNLAGATYGWEQSPAQTGLRRLARRTPVEGLYLSGHWTQPGGGVMSTTVSGLQTAQLILGHADTGKFLRSFA